jgi:phosphoribosylformylglycinamidine synthase PurS subunit
MMASEQKNAPGTNLQDRNRNVIKARITITLKNGVLDPQGKAIEGSLDALGFGDVGSVRQGKVFDVELDTSDKSQAEQNLKAMCDQLLANTVIEDYSVAII